MSAPPIPLEERRALTGAARLFGDLLLWELDAEALEGLRDPSAAAMLAGVGVTVPGPDSATQEGLDHLAAEFHAAFLSPSGGGAPPVASLWTEGRFEGAIAARIRTLADSAALDFAHEAARGAPVDHLGVLLHLWAACVERAPWAADEIAQDLLAWADAPLTQVEGGSAASPFYGSVAAATKGLLGVIRSTRVHG